MMWLGNKQREQIFWLGGRLLRLCGRAKGGFQAIAQRVSTIGQQPVELEMIRATRIASADTLWQMVNNLADLATWHPIVTGTNAPKGQQAKPGLIYRTMSRYLPVSTQVFVERVLPGELVSMRLFPLPGLQERVTYRIVSTLCGTCVLYSITLSGWLSPLAWPVVKPQVTKVATALVEAAEMETTGQMTKGRIEKIKRARQRADIFS